MVLRLGSLDHVMRLLDNDLNNSGPRTIAVLLMGFFPPHEVDEWARVEEASWETTAGKEAREGWRAAMKRSCNRLFDLLYPLLPLIFRGRQRLDDVLYFIDDGDALLGSVLTIVPSIGVIIIISITLSISSTLLPSTLTLTTLTTHDPSHLSSLNATSTSLHQALPCIPLLPLLPHPSPHRSRLHLSPTHLRLLLPLPLLHVPDTLLQLRTPRGDELEGEEASARVGQGTRRRGGGGGGLWLSGKNVWGWLAGREWDMGRGWGV